MTRDATTVEAVALGQLNRAARQLPAPTTERLGETLVIDDVTFACQVVGYYGYDQPIWVVIGPVVVAEG